MRPQLTPQQRDVIAVMDEQIKDVEGEAKTLLQNACDDLKRVRDARSGRQREAAREDLVKSLGAYAQSADTFACLKQVRQEVIAILDRR